MYKLDQMKKIMLVAYALLDMLKFDISGDLKGIRKKKSVIILEIILRFSFISFSDSTLLWLHQ